MATSIPNDVGVIPEVTNELLLMTNEKMAAYFRFEHLKTQKMRDMSQRFAQLAYEVITVLPPSAERTVTLRKLLEGKDAAVRAVLDQEEARG